MAAQIVCFFNKHGFCKYLEKCQNIHENRKCEKNNCEIRNCPLRHPKTCKFFRDYGYCKFGEWCRFDHKTEKYKSKNETEMKEVEEKLEIVKTELEKNVKKVENLENEIQDLYVKLKEKDQVLSKVNKKFNFLKEKVTLLFDLEAKFDDLEKKFEKISDEPAKVNSKDSVSQTSQKAENTGEIKWDHCEFVAKNKFGLKIHIHKKHSTARFNCFQRETHSDLVEHNDKYHYSHRIILNKKYEKEILDEFQR